MVYFENDKLHKQSESVIISEILTNHWTSPRNMSPVETGLLSRLSRQLNPEIWCSVKQPVAQIGFSTFQDPNAILYRTLHWNICSPRPYTVSDKLLWFPVNNPKYKICNICLALQTKRMHTNSLNVASYCCSSLSWAICCCHRCAVFNFPWWDTASEENVITNRRCFF